MAAQQTWGRLLWRLYDVRGRKTHTWVAIVAALLFVSVVFCCVPWFADASRGLRVATFNIENFPKHERQHEGAFREILATKASVLGIQEIVSPSKFVLAARKHLGSNWAVEYTKTPSPQRLGVVYDKRRFRLVRKLEHKAPMLYPRARPAFEVILEERATGEPLHLWVLHLKAGGDGEAMRRRQWDTLEPLIEARRASGARLVILGDMNATGPGDRRKLGALAERHRMSWATQGLACTSYWRRRDGCKTSALDHVLTSTGVGAVRLEGACGRQGCTPGKACPEYCQEVSDHCPVVVELVSKSR